MATRALKVAVHAALLVTKAADGYMPHHQQLHDVEQDLRHPAICSGVNPLSQRFGGKAAPAVLMAGSLPVAASAITASSSSSAQPTSTYDVGLGSDEACGTQDAECHSDATGEMTFSMLCWICKFFVWNLVVRAMTVTAVYVAGSATALFVAIGTMASALRLAVVLLLG